MGLFARAGVSSAASARTRIMRRRPNTAAGLLICMLHVQGLGGSELEHGPYMVDIQPSML